MAKHLDNVDLDLVRQAQQGEADSAAVLAERTQARVYTYIHRMTLDSHLAEDLSQETMLRLISSLPELEFANVKFFWAWVYKTALSRVQDYMRSERHRPRPSPIVEDAADMARADEETGLHGMVRKELLAAVWRAMQGLNLRYRNILALRCLDGLSYTEIAAATGGSELAAKLLFFRAKRSLQRQLAKDGFGRSSLPGALGLFAVVTAHMSQKATAAGAICEGTLQAGMGIGLLSVATSKVTVVALCVAGLGVFAAMHGDRLPRDVMLVDYVSQARIDSNAFSYPTSVLGSYTRDGKGFQLAYGTPPHQVGPAGSLESLLVGKPSETRPCLILPPGNWVLVGFDGRIVDGPGPDILIEGWGCREQRITLTDGGNRSLTLPLSPCEGNHGQFGVLAYDLARLKVPFEARAIRVQGDHFFTPTEHYRLSAVRARISP
jgi:RNA polymerase sigma-70 factor, ECF subfamily